MAGPFQREPGDPTGSRPLDIWLRALKRWVRGLELKSGPGYRKIPSPDGGFTLSIDTIPSASVVYPYQLYQGSTWLKWKVRAGTYIYTPSGDLVEATNTDTEITITENVARYWFYINLSTGAVAASDTRPTWSATIIPIGYVDTDTYADDERAVAVQFIHDNIFSPCE